MSREEPTHVDGTTQHEDRQTGMRSLWMLFPGFFIGAQANGEFDDSLKWIAEFLKYLCGFTIQEGRELV